MKLIDKPLDRQEIRNITDSIDGNIARICVSDDVEEIVAHLGFATDRLSMIAYSRIKHLKMCSESEGV